MTRPRGAAHGPYHLKVVAAKPTMKLPAVTTCSRKVGPIWELVLDPTTDYSPQAK